MKTRIVPDASPDFAFQTFLRRYSKSVLGSWRAQRRKCATHIISLSVPNSPAWGLANRFPTILASRYHSCPASRDIDRLRHACGWTLATNLRTGWAVEIPPFHPDRNCLTLDLLFGYGAGLLALINPCVLPILPIILGSALRQEPFGACRACGGAQHGVRHCRCRHCGGRAGNRAGRRPDDADRSGGDDLFRDGVDHAGTQHALCRGDSGNFRACGSTA